MFTKKITHQNNNEESRQNNNEKSYREKKVKHEPSGWAMFTRRSFDKVNYYRGKDCIEEEHTRARNENT